MTESTETSFVFQRVIDGLRKPKIRFHLPSGRQVELISFHLEPAWSMPPNKPILREILDRLYPNCRTVILPHPDTRTEMAFGCVALFYSDQSSKGQGNGIEYSSLVIGGLIENIDRGIRAIATELLSQVNWEIDAEDDVMW